MGADTLDEKLGIFRAQYKIKLTSNDKSAKWIIGKVSFVEPMQGVLQWNI